MLQAKIEMLHEAVSKGQLGDMEKLLGEEKSQRMALCKDGAGVPLLHKAVYYNHPDVVKWLVEAYPLTVSTKDKVSACSVTNECILCFLSILILLNKDSVDGARRPKDRDAIPDTGKHLSLVKNSRPL